MSAEALAYKDAVGWEARSEGVEPLTGSVYLKVDVYPKRQSRDLDNCLKVLIDALKGHAYQDDKQIVMITAIKHRFGDCRVEVEVGTCEIH